MNYEKFISYADEGSLGLNLDPETGIIKIRMRVNGMPVHGQSSVDVEGIYAFGIYGDDFIEETLKRLSR